jgi:hypothetical protein
VGGGEGECGGDILLSGDMHGKIKKWNLRGRATRKSGSGGGGGGGGGGGLKGCMGALLRGIGMRLIIPGRHILDR